MKIGVVYPQTELEGNPIAVKEIGLATEDLAMTTCWHMTTLLGLSMRVGSLNYGAHIRMKTHFTVLSRCLAILPGLHRRSSLLLA